MQRVVCVIPNTALGACHLPTKTVSAPDQRQRERTMRAVQSAGYFCSMDTSSTFL